MLRISIPPLPTDIPGTTHVSTDWQVSTNNDFSAVVEESLEDSVNLTEYNSMTLYGTSIFYVRTRYHMLKDGVPEISNWSNIVAVASNDSDVIIQGYLTIVTTQTAIMAAQVDIRLDIISIKDELVIIKSDIVVNADDIAAHEIAISSVLTDLDDLATLIAGDGNSILGNAQAISDLSDSISTRINGVDVQIVTLFNNLDLVGDGVTANELDITNLTTTVSDMDTAYKLADTTLTGILNGRIDTEVSDLEDADTALSDRITDNADDITLLNTAIITTVTAAEDYTDNASLGLLNVTTVNSTHSTNNSLKLITMEDRVGDLESYDANVVSLLSGLRIDLDNLIVKQQQDEDSRESAVTSEINTSTLALSITLNNSISAIQQTHNAYKLAADREITRLKDSRTVRNYILNSDLTICQRSLGSTAGTDDIITDMGMVTGVSNSDIYTITRPVNHGDMLYVDKLGSNGKGGYTAIVPDARRFKPGDVYTFSFEYEIVTGYSGDMRLEAIFKKEGTYSYAINIITTIGINDGFGTASFTFTIPDTDSIVADDLVLLLGVRQDTPVANKMGLKNLLFNKGTLPAIYSPPDPEVEITKLYRYYWESFQGLHLHQNGTSTTYYYDLMYPVAMHSVPLVSLFATNMSNELTVVEAASQPPSNYTDSYLLLEAITDGGANAPRLNFIALNATPT